MLVVTAFSLCSLLANAEEQEYIDGIPVSEIAKFVYPEYPLSEAIEYFREEYYGDSERLQSIKSVYESSISTVIIDESMQRTLGLADDLKKELNERPYIKQLYFGERLANLTRANYQSVPLYWNKVKKKDVNVKTKVVGKADADSLLVNGVNFDLDLVTTNAIDYLVVSDFQICSLSASVASQCKTDKLTTYTPAPLSKVNMFRAKNKRNIDKPTPTGTITPANALGLYEQSKYYKEHVNKNAKLILSISANLEQISSSAQAGQFINRIVSYMDEWGYDGVIFTTPTFSLDEGSMTHSIFRRLREQVKQTKLIALQVYSSHQLDDWNKNAFLALQNDLDFIKVSLNRQLDDDIIEHSAPSYHAHVGRLKNYQANFKDMLMRLIKWGVTPEKIIANLESEWKVDHYSRIISEPRHVGGASLLTLQATANRDVDSPGTFRSGWYHFYDIDSQLSKWTMRAGVEGFNDYYQKFEDKLITSGNTQQMAHDKVIASLAFNVGGHSIRLDHDNGKMAAAIIEANNKRREHHTFKGHLVIEDNGQWAGMISQLKFMLINNANGIKSDAANPIWEGRTHNIITVPVVDENGKTHELRLKARKHGNTPGVSINSAAPYGRNHYVNTLNYRTDVAEKYSLDISSDNVLPAGRYRSIKPLIMTQYGWHDRYNYGFNTAAYRTIEIDVDVNYTPIVSVEGVGDFLAHNVRMTPGNAMQYCANLSAGKGMWALPSIEQLKSLYRAHPNGALMNAILPRWPTGYYWAATSPKPGYNNDINLANGSHGYNSDNLTYNVACFREELPSTPFISVNLTDDMYREFTTPQLIGDPTDAKQDTDDAIIQELPNWQAAVTYCQKLDGGHAGWRLPEISELEALYAKHPNGDVSNKLGWPKDNAYWSATKVPGKNKRYYASNLDKGDTHEIVGKYAALYASCTRDMIDHEAVYRSF